ncbi:ribulokinase [Paucilactobacillus hokkaidonensis JCM 18461]|uniref:Ribulokinase n=2 Tax=Paucilactobacillus hokkaidonensis TaxID=1193095 RepID=A0A0A1GWW6_9LACO|nr:FGGY-family carbohydrate kinase [Paucilactobacillus hokkaidonensis]KRO11082.1 carbohydrate kinase [Paucilactobacillus hokkaidonensis]BAP86555.1 ribulokinase [Paucilactobacillus hokkaidonensis JCM 18461]
MDNSVIKDEIVSGHISLGIELGSTRIKSVLVTDNFQTVASGDYLWENELDQGIWTYSLNKVWEGIQTSYANLATEVNDKYGVEIKNIGAIGVSAMMHGYMPFDKDGEMLVPFRTWRNNITGKAATELTELFNFNIPERWSIAHLYQAILNKEEHVKNVDFITTLDGYVSWKLSGEKTTGVGDASGIFPIDETTANYDESLLEKFRQLPAVKQYQWDISSILPKVLVAGEDAGKLTAEGAALLDPSGQLEAGALMAPSEGDAGTGMVSTNAVRKRTGNISAGTSAFSMVVLDRPMKKVHRDIDMVTTPDGAPVAMVHTNNCSSDINAWTTLFSEFARAIGSNLKPNDLYAALFDSSLRGDQDAGGLVNFSYLSGENVTKMPEGRPMFVRKPDSNFNLANFFKVQLYSAFAPLKIGMDILLREEHIKTDVLIAQGGLFKTPVVAQQVLADALNTPITVMGNAGEGGPWGMAILALFAKNHKDGQTLADFLDDEVFTDSDSSTLDPEPISVRGYEKFIDNYKAALPVEGQAVESMKMN